MNFGELKLELQKQSLDLGQAKRPEARYGEALNRALSFYPRILWALVVDGTTVDTTADTREIALSGISDISKADQVRRVWIDDSDGEKRLVARLEVQDNDGAITIVLDTAPDDAYDVTVEYQKPPTAMSGDSDNNTTDDEWLIAKAMSLLLVEADWTIEEAEKVLTQLAEQRQAAQDRERYLRRQLRGTARRMRSTRWRNYVQ